MPNHLPQMVFTKPLAPKTSWWVSQGTREAFQEAHAREVARMKQDSRATGAEKVVGTHYGKV